MCLGGNDASSFLLREKCIEPVATAVISWPRTASSFGEDKAPAGRGKAPVVHFSLNTKCLI